MGITLTDSLVSSSSRGMPLRKRPDLSARRQQYLGRSYWVVKEPVGLNYFRFQEEEFAILQMLDGKTSLDEIKERFEAEFPPQKITLEELQQFLGMLHRSGLIIADAGGQGHELRKRRDERRRKEILGAATNILCIRFKGIDPERFLNWLYPKLRFLFSTVACVVYSLLCLCALTLVLVEFDVFQSKLPGFYQFFNLHNALWLAVTLGVIKVFHEFGHGLSCKHFGGECHEIGIMILVLTPCLYCNVSDSWMLPNKWHRAAIGAAGIFIEVVFASIATFLWWFSEPGLFNNLCLNIMFVASVSTILFNANPLLRYDGYYVLADVAEIPNLRQKATSILSRKMGHWFLGIEPPEDPFLPQRNQIFFVFYSVAAGLYRWFVLASIMWFLYQVFKPYHLEIIGQGIIMMSLYGLIVMPIYKVGKFFYVPGRIEKVKKPRMYTSLTGLIAIILGVVFVPLPHSVMCLLEIQARDARPVYVSVPEGGRLEEVFVEPGDQVTQGQLLARLVNRDIDLEIEQLKGRQAEYQVRLEGLRRLRITDRQASAEIPALEESLKTIDEELEEKKVDRQRLNLTAPRAGTVLPPTLIPDVDTEDERLASWSGTPLDPENLGAHLEQRTFFCQIGNPRELEAILVIDQTDKPFVEKMTRAGERPKVEIKLDELPHNTFTSYVSEIAIQPMTVAPKKLSTKSGGDMATISDPESGIERPQSVSFQARAPLDDPDNLLKIGLRGRAKIHTEWIPIGTRIWRFITHTFNFRL